MNVMDEQLSLASLILRLVYDLSITPKSSKCSFDRQVFFKSFQLNSRKLCAQNAKENEVSYNS